jgi:hypothetical protein
MKVSFIHEGVFGSYKNTKTSGKDIARGIASSAIFEKYKSEIMDVYVADIKELMDTRVDSPFGGTDSKYRICNRYVPDISEDAYGIGARPYCKGNTVVIEQMVSFQTSNISGGSRSLYTCPEELLFWENEETKLSGLFPKFKFKIILDWVYLPDAGGYIRTVDPEKEAIEHHPFPYPLNSNTNSGTITLGHTVTLNDFIKYWNRFAKTEDKVQCLAFEHPPMESLEISIPSNFKTGQIMIRGGLQLTDIDSAKAYMTGNSEIVYNLYGFRDFSSRRRDGQDIDPKFKEGVPAFEKATNGLMSLDNLTYLFDNSPNGSLVCSYFMYSPITHKGRIFDVGYNVSRNIVSDWFSDDKGFRKAVDMARKKKESMK